MKQKIYKKNRESTLENSRKKSQNKSEKNVGPKYAGLALRGWGPRWPDLGEACARPDPIWPTFDLAQLRPAPVQKISKKFQKILKK